MKQKKYTKRALCMSLLSMLLCCSMLVGTTFAWFTDSVTSGRNQIVAGNLDVELEYAAAFDSDGSVTEWKPVTETTDLFAAPDGRENLWEPGHTEVAYLRVRNVGTLALKYSLSAAVYGADDGETAESTYTNVNGAEVKLSQFLVFRTVDGAKKIENREELWLEGAEMGKPDAIGISDEVLYPAEKADGTHASEKIFTLAVYMPTTVGNDANWNGEGGTAPTIYLGLNLTASQTPFESDSFDANYDSDTSPATPPEAGGTAISGSLTGAQNEGGQQFYRVGDDNITVDVPAEDVPGMENQKIFLVVKTLDVTDDYSYNLDISLEDAAHHKIANAAGTKMYRVSVYIGGGLFDVAVSHEGTPLSDGGSWESEGYTYDIDTGFLTLYVEHFSKFAITWTVPATPTDRGTELETLEYSGISNISGTNFTNGKKYLKKDVTPSGASTAKKDLVLDMNGYKMTFGNSNGIALKVNNCNLTLRNGTISFGSQVTTYGINVASGNSHITFENCTIKASASPALLHSDSAGAVFTLRNCTVTGNVDVTNGTLLIVSGTYSFDPTPYLAVNSTAAEQDGVWVVTATY